MDALAARNREIIGGGCTCHKCYAAVRATFTPLDFLSKQIFIVCETCGNKRCPKATDHNLECTGSNAAGQPGSIYQ